MLPTDLIPVREIALRFPDLLPQRHPRTFMNWHTKGVAGAFLQIAYVGTTACTSKTWMQEFINAVTKAKAKSG